MLGRSKSFFKLLLNIFDKEAFLKKWDLSVKLK